MPLAPGTPAPDFTLMTKSEAGLKAVTLSQHRGKDVVVLLFFPAAYTSVCTQELCDTSNGVHGMHDAVVYGISTDLPYAQEAWAKANGIRVPILSDAQHRVIRDYDAMWPDMYGLGPVAARASFVIDRRGVVTYSHQTPTLGDMPDFAAIQLAVEAAVVGKV